MSAPVTHWQSQWHSNFSFDKAAVELSLVGRLGLALVACFGGFRFFRRWFIALPASRRLRLAGGDKPIAIGVELNELFAAARKLAGASPRRRGSSP